MQEQLIFRQLQQMPDNLKQEVLDFIVYLFSKHQLAVPKSHGNRKKTFGKYRGCLKTGLSVSEIDAQLLQLRNEWERTIS